MFALSTILEEIAGALRAAIDDTGVPDVCFLGVIPGSALAIDYAGDCRNKNGTAWVRLVSLYPASGINVADDRPANCASVLGADIEIGMMRRMPLMSGTGKPPSPAEYLKAAERANDDALVMIQALRCYLRGGQMDHVLGQYSPTGPFGDTFGGTISVALLVED